LLYRPSGKLARVSVVVDQLDDFGMRVPLIEDVLAAFPYAELHVIEDRRATPGPVAGATPTVWAGPPAPSRAFWRRPRPAPPPTPELGDYDVILRMGDRRSRGFFAPAEALDLTYILAIDEEHAPAGGRKLAKSLRDRCAMHAADIVWCSSRRLLATLRRRWGVDAHLLYPPGELGTVGGATGERRLVVAVGDGIPPGWAARLDTVARWRHDLDFVHHGAPRGSRRSPRVHVVEPTPERFRALLSNALAVVLPPGELFDPRAVWAAEAGVPVIAPISSASAEVVEGLERRDPTGVLLEESTETALADALAFVQQHSALFDPDRLRTHAARWSHARFRQTLKSLVLDGWCNHVAATEAAIEADAVVDRQTAGSAAS
jgi:hypothetical protein